MIQVATMVTLVGLLGILLMKEQVVLYMAIIRKTLLKRFCLKARKKLQLFREQSKNCRGF